MTNVIGYYEHDKIRDLLVGRTFLTVGDHTGVLDNGVVLEFPDTDGGCACSAGCYDLTVLNSIDHVITDVQVVEDPGGDDYGTWENPKYEGTYQIFVFADNERVNLATWEGSDGNGYYGTGFSIRVALPA